MQAKKGRGTENDPRDRELDESREGTEHDTRDWWGRKIMAVILSTIQETHERGVSRERY